MILVMSQKLFIKIFLIHWKFILFPCYSHVPPPSKKIQKKNSKNKKEEINLEIEIKNSNPKSSLKNEKKFSFTKSKKLIKKKSEKDLKEIYLLAGIMKKHYFHIMTHFHQHIKIVIQMV